MMRGITSLLGAVLIICFSSPLLSQTTPDTKPAAEAKQSASSAAETPKFTSRTQLVLVPVIVNGKDGQHMGGLGRGAFKIEEQGKVREATIFEEVKTVAPDAKARPVAAVEGHTNFGFSDAKNWRMTVVVLDMLNTPFLSQADSKKQLIQYLSKSLQRDEPTSLFGLGRNGLKQLHPFTTDTGVLVAALRKVNGQVGVDEINDQSAGATEDTAAEMEASGNAEMQAIAQFMRDSEGIMNAFQQRESIRTTLTAMTQIAHAYTAIPGRKTMIWASGGFPFMIDDPQAFAHMGTDMMGLYDQTWRALVSADIAVYTVDVTGLSPSGSGGNYDASRHSSGIRPPSYRPGSNAQMRVPYDKNAEKQATLRAFADATGGISCVNTNDLEKCFARAIEDSREYYMLGYYLPVDDQKPGWRKLKVKVDAGGAHARAREGFYVGTAVEETQEVRNRQIVDALQSPVEFTGVRFSVAELPAGGSVKPVAVGKTLHEFKLTVQGRSITVDAQNQNAVDMTFISVAFGADGKSAGQTERHWTAKLTPEMLQRVRQSGMGLKQSLELAPGKYNMRVAVRDNLNGEIGSVEYPLVVK